MSRQAIIEDLSRAALGADPTDLPCLVRMHVALESLAEEFPGDDASRVVAVIERAAKLLEELTLRERDDGEAALEMVRKSIEFVQRASDADDRGEALTSIAGSPFDAEAPVSQSGPPIDRELLAAWVSECEGSLVELEATVVGMKPGDEEAVAEARRRIHTLKGECGVLSLGAAQRVCHEAESAIDRRLSAGESFPCDAVIGVVDWMKAYVARLAKNAEAAAPATDDVLRGLAGESLGSVSTGAKASARGPASGVSAPGSPGDGPVEFPPEAQADENLREFLTESREHIAAAEEALLELEREPSNNELINTVFRAFHTIKGVAGFMSLGPIVELAHNAEYLLDGARTGKIGLTSAHLDLILHCCDCMGQMIGALGGGAPPTKSSLAALVDVVKRACAGEAPECAFPRAAAPTTGEGGPACPPLGKILVQMGVATTEQVADALCKQAASAARLCEILTKSQVLNADAAQRALLEGPAQVADGLREFIVAMGVASRDELERAIGQLRRGGGRLGAILGLGAKDLAPALRAQREAQREAQQLKPADSDAARRADQTVKVSTTRMDTLVDMVGELVIAQQMVVQDPQIRRVAEPRVQRNLAHVGKIIRDLQQVSMALRMVTLKGTFQKMARLVRDVSAKAGKQIEFRAEGEDVELDRNVVEAIADPLVHMIRNACDHGVEPAAERVAAGKPATGALTLAAYHSGGSIIIEIRDDGRGLRRDKILAKAVEKGIYTPDRPADDIPDSEVFGLIFLPGFSTAERVTDISGRGVGMDVVRRNIEALRGRVEIRSTPGRGTTFLMRLPLTMAIIDGMIVRVGSQRYVVPTLAIEQSFRPTPGQLHTAMERGEMVSVRGSLLPIYRLKRALGQADGIDDLREGLLLALESNENRCCVMVDEIIGQQQVVIKTLGRAAAGIRGVSGGAILGDGRVALILDVGGIVAHATAAGANAD